MNLNRHSSVMARLFRIGIILVPVSIAARSVLADCTDPVLEWQINEAGNEELQIHDVTTGPSGEIYFVGSYTQTHDFDPTAGVDIRTPTPSSGGEFPVDLFVTRLESDGSYGWTYTDGADGIDQSLAVDIAPGGNIVVAGFFTTSLNAGGLVSAGDDDCFLMKLTSAGSVVWATSFGIAGQQEAVALAVDQNSGRSYVCYRFGNTGDFLLAYDTSGNIDWPSAILVQDKVQDLAVDSQGNVLVCVKLSTLFGSRTLKLDSTGSEIWRNEIVASVFPVAIAVDADDQVFVVGSWGSTVPIDFDPGQGTDMRTVTQQSSGQPRDVFVTSYLADGSYEWTWTSGSSSKDLGNGIAYDPNTDSIIVTGEMPESVGFLIQLYDQNTTGWMRQVQGGPNKLAIDSAGKIVTVGGDNEVRRYSRSCGVLVAGDCDGSGILDLSDVPCFVNALLGTDTNPPGGIARSDLNADGDANGADVQSFVDALLP